MPNHHSENGNGRSARGVALPDENRPSWRPQDEQHRARRAISEEDDRYEDDRYARHWDDRDRRDWDRGERYGSFESRNQGYAGSFEDRQRERGGERGSDDRSGSRGGSAYYDRGYSPERVSRSWDAERIVGGPRGYGYNEGDRQIDRPIDRPVDRPNLGTGGAMHGGSVSGTYPTHQGARDGSTGYSGTYSHRGKGPQSYQRSDERIREIICEVLTDDDRIDASNIEVSVKNGEVMLTGTVKERQMKRAAEELVEGISGVKDVQNQIRYR